MPFDIVEIPTGGGGWLKPAEHADDVAIIVEVKAFDRQRPTPNGPKDSALADITAFATDADLDAGTPTYEVKGQRIEQTVLARDLAQLVGKVTIVTLAQTKPSKPGQKPAWVWRATNVDTKTKAIEFLKAREAREQEALAAAPDFD